MKVRLFTTTVCLAVLVLCARSSAQNSPEELGLKLEVSAVSGNYPAGQDVVLRLTLSNVGKRPVYVPNGFFFSVCLGAGLSVQVSDANGQPLVPMYCDVADPLPPPPPPEVIASILGLPAAPNRVRIVENQVENRNVETVKKWNVLRPGYSFSTQISVSRDVVGLEPLKPGRYVIEVALRSPVFSESEVQTLTASLPYPFLNGSIEAKPIRVVHGRTGKKAVGAAKQQ